MARSAIRQPALPFARLALVAGLVLSGASALATEGPLPQPLTLKFCVFDFQGNQGDISRYARDLGQAAQRWNLRLDIRSYTDERIAAEDFKAGQCDGVALSPPRAGLPIARAATKGAARARRLLPPRLQRPTRWRGPANVAAAFGRPPRGASQPPPAQPTTSRRGCPQRRRGGVTIPIAKPEPDWTDEPIQAPLRPLWQLRSRRDALPPLLP